MITPAKKYLTSYEVANWLGIAPRTVTEWAAQWQDSGGLEGIPAFKLGRSWRFDAARIEKWLSEKQTLAALSIA